MPEAKKKHSFLEDSVRLGNSALRTAGCALSCYGLEYFSQQYLGASASELIEPTTKVFSPESGIFLAQTACVVGAIIEGIKTGYSALAIPAKLVTGKYFGKKAKTV